MTRTGDKAVAWARTQVTTPARDYYRLCLMFVRMCFNVPMREADAGKAWDNAQHKHATTDAGSIPAGVPVFWELGSVADHIALSIGGGACISTDVRRRGKPDVVRIDSITENWGGRLLGWTEDLNGVRVYLPENPAPDRSNLGRAKLKSAQRTVEQVEDMLDSYPKLKARAVAAARELGSIVDAIGRKVDE